MSYVVETPSEGETNHAPAEITPDPLSDDFLSWVQVTTTRPGTWPDSQKSFQVPPLESEPPLLSSYADQKERARRLDATRKKKLVWSYESTLDAARWREEECTKKVVEAEDLLATLEHQYENLLQKVQEAAQSHPLPNEKVLILRERLGECARALEEQQLALERAREEDDVALASRLALEVQAKGVEVLDGAVADGDGEIAFLTQLATRRKEDESANAKRYRKASRKLRLLADEEQLKQAELDRAVVEEAEAGRRGAVARMKATIAAIRQNESAKDSGRNSERNRKTAALLQLKRNTEAIKADVESKNVTRQRRLKLAEEARAKEAEALLKSGKNPYEVFRRREQEEARARERARLDGTRRRQEAEFAVGMEAEAAQQQKVAARMKAFEARQMPVKLDDPDRWQKYLQARALPGLELSEITKPGGFLPSKIADPSKILNKYQVGLGIASKSTVDALQKLYHESPSELLIPQSPNKPSDRKSNGQNQATESLVEPQSLVGGSDASDDENVGPGAQPRVRARSVWEEQRLAAARARHKATMPKKQVVWGKEFSGAAFLPTPAEVVFRDFEVGQTYRCRFTLTNVSYTFNTFKIGELPDAVRDFFLVEYAFPGQVSAGMSCEVTITFTPKVNEDIFEELPVLAETGPRSVPIQCLIKRTVICTEPSSNRLDFGMVTRAEKSVKTLTIENRGALPTTFELEEEGGEDDRGPSVLSYTKTGLVGGYSKARVDFTYAPLEEGPLRKTLCIKFTTKEVDDLRFDVSGACGDVPIYLQDEEVDFKCCVVDQVYRNVLVVANRGKTSMKVTLTAPKPLAGSLQIVPELGYVQAGSTFSFQLKFSPTKDLLKSLSVNQEGLSSLILTIPMRLRVPEQTFPVTAVLKATLTSAELHFSPARLDFDTCTVGESVARNLTLTNPSALPLRYGCHPLPKGVSVKPGEGYGSLLPGESVERSVIFTPHAATLYSFQLPCWTSLAPAEPFKVPCVGTGVLSPLVFAANRLELPATPLGSVTTTTLILKNVSSTPQSFEFAVPPTGGALRISPSVDTIPAGKATTIQVEFRPIATADVKPTCDADVAAETGRVSSGEVTRSASRTHLGGLQEDGFENGVTFNHNSSDVSFCLRQKYVISCLIKKHRGQAHSDIRITNLVTAPEPAPQSGGDASLTTVGSVTLHVEIHTTVIEPQLAIEDVPGGADPQGFYPLDFGQVPVGKRVVKTFTLRHVGSRPLRIFATPLGHDGIFTRVNALRELHPSEEVSGVDSASGGVSSSAESNPPESEAAGSSEARAASGEAAETNQRLGVEESEPGTFVAVDVNGPGLPEEDYSITRVPTAAQSGETETMPADVSGMPSTSPDVGPNLAAVKSLNPSKRPPSHQRVTVEFSPAARIRYREVMHIYTEGGLGATRLSVLLLGEGISPTMHLDPDVSAVDLGHVLAGESVEKGFNIVNTSPFALTFRLRFGGTVQRNRSGMEPIFCKPAEGTIEAGQRAPVAIVFNPDRPGCSYGAHLLVEVPNQDKEVRIDLNGCCWDQALFYSGADAEDEPSEGGSLSKAATVTLVVDVARPLPSRTLTLGCAEGGKPGAKAPSGEFTIEGLEKGSANATQGWSVDVSRGSLGPGERKPVTFSYSAPKRTGGDGAAIIELGESVEAKVVLHWKGGFPPAKEPQVHLTLICVPQA